MANEGEARFLPLSFYDGKCEFNIGQIRIHSSLDYKAFQSILSQRIGISPNQMSIYFIDSNNNNPKVMMQQRRRILITGKASFNLILQAKDCCTVLVVLKRSRKDRRQRSKLTYNIHANTPVPADNNSSLTRPEAAGFYACPTLPHYDQIAMQELLDYNNRLRNYHPLIMGEPYFVPERCKYSYCDECMKARRQGEAVQFHLCVNDAVTPWFRSRAGPIARPGGT